MRSGTCGKTHKEVLELGNDGRGQLRAPEGVYSVAGCTRQSGVCGEPSVGIRRVVMLPLPGVVAAVSRYNVSRALFSMGSWEGQETAHEHGEGDNKHAP